MLQKTFKYEGFTEQAKNHTNNDFEYLASARGCRSVSAVEPHDDIRKKSKKFSDLLDLP